MSGPPTQSEIDYGCPLHQVRRNHSRMPWLAIMFMCLVVIVIVCAWGLQ